MTESVARDIAFEMAASSIRFGVGVTREIGMDLAELGARRVEPTDESFLDAIAFARAHHAVRGRGDGVVRSG